MTDILDDVKKLDILKVIELSGAKIIANESFEFSLHVYKEEDPELYEFITKNLSIDDIIEDIFLQLYDKYFTHTEIKELIQFYESPLGTKVLRVSPQIMREAAVMSEEYINKKLDKLEY